MSLLYLTFLFPLAGYLLLAFGRGRLSENVSAVIGVGSVGLSALTALAVGYDFLTNPPAGGAYTQVLYTWMQVGEFAPKFALRLDGLSLTMLGVVSGVGFLIHLFASWYMRGEAGYERFFAYMNLFVAAMLLLVLGDNLLLLYLGWEGVGLCSYLLIGFYFTNPEFGKAARKAFIVTRIGDTFMVIGLFLLWSELGTLDIQTILAQAPAHFAVGSVAINLIALLLLGGAVGKSAQLPLQTWLPDAMAGPTPVSALIHAATMVTAGVYLIARTHTVFELAPDVQSLVGGIGAVGLLIAGLCALVQTDIKRVLAYSTMSQIAYMFLALGVGAWGAAVFHLMTHAFFKALLFLSAGSVIIATHHEQDIRKMGGLRKSLPLVYACFLVGGGALAALPFVTVGFYSKDAILWEALAGGHDYLLAAGLVGAFLTSIYTFRLIFLVFHGEEKIHAHAGHGLSHHLPLVLLLLLSTGLGALITPPLASVLPAGPGIRGSEEDKHLLEWISIAIALGGVAIAAVLYLGKRELVNSVAQSALGRSVSCWWRNAFGFDWLYERLFVRPWLGLVWLLSRDPADQTIGLIPRLMQWGHGALSLTENGRVRWYAASMAFGAVLVVGALVLVQ